MKFPKSILSKNGLWRQLFEIDCKSTFSKKWVLQKFGFYYLFLVNKL